MNSQRLQTSEQRQHVERRKETVPGKSNLAKVLTISTLSLLAAPSLSHARECAYQPREALAAASNAMLNGPSNQRVCISGSEFVITSLATIVPSPDGQIHMMTGTMRRTVAWLPDDLISYAVRYDDGTPDWKNAEFRIERGGLVGIVRSTLSLAGTWILTVIGRESLIDALADRDQGFGASEDGSGWQSQVVAMVAYTALSAATPSTDRGALPPGTQAASNRGGQHSSAEIF